MNLEWLGDGVVFLSCSAPLTNLHILLENVELLKMISEPLLLEVKFEIHGLRLHLLRTRSVNQ